MPHWIRPDLTQLLRELFPRSALEEVDTGPNAAQGVNALQHVIIMQLLLKIGAINTYLQRAPLPRALARHRETFLETLRIHRSLYVVDAVHVETIFLSQTLFRRFIEAPCAQLVCAVLLPECGVNARDLYCGSMRGVADRCLGHGNQCSLTGRWKLVYQRSKDVDYQWRY